MAAYLQAVWRCRYFWLSLVKMDLRTRYRRSVLGIGWSLLQPITMTLLLTGLFSAKFQEEAANYALYLLSGLSCWQYLTAVASQGCQCFFRGEAYIRQYPAPMAIYPLRVALGAMIHLLIALGFVAAIAVVLKGPACLGHLLGMLPGIVLLLALGWAVAALTGIATVYFNDTQHLIEVGLQLLFYATPIMYKADMLRGARVGLFVRYNPLLYILHLVRAPIVEDKVPTLTTFGVASALTLGAAFAASLVLARLERRLIFHL
ncbi:MAG TPA: ABC transporter permease [Gemmataceae bacterium]|nr:ABC transporter permease [Gemmataceae bacterium]